MKKIKIIARNSIYDFFEGRVFNDDALKILDACFEDVIEVDDKLSLQQAMKLYEQQKPSVKNYELECSVI